jgi:hypothetical protein
MLSACGEDEVQGDGWGCFIGGVGNAWRWVPLLPNCVPPGFCVNQWLTRITDRSSGLAHGFGILIRFVVGLDACGFSFSKEWGADFICSYRVARVGA